MWNPHASSADFCRREMLQKRAREERSRRRKAARDAAKNARADWSIRAADCKDRSCRALHEREWPINVGAITENVSLRGARPLGLITDSACGPGELVRLDAPKEHLNLPARVVYCAGRGKFAVGLQLACALWGGRRHRRLTVVRGCC